MRLLSTIKWKKRNKKRETWHIHTTNIKLSFGFIKNRNLAKLIQDQVNYISGGFDLHDITDVKEMLQRPIGLLSVYKINNNTLKQTINLQVKKLLEENEIEFTIKEPFALLVEAVVFLIVTIPVELIEPPIFISPLIPDPPETTREPVDVVVLTEVFCDNIWPEE